MGQTLMFLTSDTPPYDLPGHNVTVHGKGLNRWILDKDSGPMHGEFEETSQRYVGNSMHRILQGWREISTGKERLGYVHEQSHLLTENVTH